MKYYQSVKSYIAYISQMRCLFYEVIGKREEVRGKRRELGMVAVLTSDGAYGPSFFCCGVIKMLK